jgi:hypothetical protein
MIGAVPERGREPSANASIFKLIPFVRSPLVHERLFELS